MIGYYDIFVDYIYGESVILDYFTSKDFYLDDIVIVFLDVGGVLCVCVFVKKFNDVLLVIIDKWCIGYNKV